MPFDFNVDVKLTDDNDASNVQFINMTIGSAPAGKDKLHGEWRGASVFVPAPKGEFDWDGRPGHGVAFVFDGPSSGTRLVLVLNDFVGSGGGLPTRGTTGGGVVKDPVDPLFLGTITWEIT